MFSGAFARAPAFALASLAAVLALGCAGDAGGQANDQGESFLDGDLAGDLPETLSRVGLYPMLDDRSAWHARARPFEPHYPLFSNGSTKQRFIVLPEGGAVDTQQAVWRFPEGTLFFKTFSFEDTPSGARPVETRVLRATADGFAFAAYLWNADGTDADLLAGRRPTKVRVEHAGEAFDHEVPSTLECRTCHETHDPMVLGFSELQLNTTLDGEQETELERLAEEGVLSAAPRRPRAIPEDDPTAHAVLGYLEGNCTNCHDGGNGDNSGFDLRYEVAFQNLIGVKTTSELLSGVRVTPGAPEESVAYLALTRDAELVPQFMPPLGVQRRDEAALSLVEDWILSLGAE